MSIQGAERSHIKHGDKENYADQKEFGPIYDSLINQVKVIKANFPFINKERGHFLFSK